MRYPYDAISFISHAISHLSRIQMFRFLTMWFCRMLFSSAGVQRSPSPFRIRLVWEAQLVLHVVGDSLCIESASCGQPLEGGVVLAAGVLEPDLRWLLLGHVLDRGRCMFIPGSCSCGQPPWLQKVLIHLHRAAQVVTGSQHKCP